MSYRDCYYMDQEITHAIRDLLTVFGIRTNDENARLIFWGQTQLLNAIQNHNYSYVNLSIKRFVFHEKNICLNNHWEVRIGYTCRICHRDRQRHTNMFIGLPDGHR